jgi:hypothetical protein
MMEKNKSMPAKNIDESSSRSGLIKVGECENKL